MSVHRDRVIRIFFGLSLITALGLSACGGTAPTATQAPITVVTALGTPIPTNTPIPPEDIDISFDKDGRGCLQPEEAYETLILDEQGLCFIFPEYFESLEEPANGYSSEVIGPAYSSEGEEARATLSIAVEPLAGKMLEDFVDALIEANPGENIFESPLQIDEMPAVTLEGVPGELPNRIALVAANQRAYSITVSPLGDLFPDAATEAELLWSIAITSMRFFPPQSEVLEDEPPIDTADWRETEFAGRGVRLLLPPEWEVASAADQVGLRPSSASSDLLVFSTLSGLPTENATLMANAINARLMEAGANEPVSEPVVMNRIEGVVFYGDPDVCQTIYIPAFEQVHEIRLAPEACTPTGDPMPIVQTILDSVRFSAP